MNIAHFAGAVLAATIVSSFTDWFFFGVLFHSRYQAYPEVWRSEFSGNKEWNAIMIGHGSVGLHGGHVPVPRAPTGAPRLSSPTQACCSNLGNRCCANYYH
jgi:hypothetical protein